MLRYRRLPLLAALIVILSLGSLVLLVNATNMQQVQLLEHSAERGLTRGLARELNNTAAVARDVAWWDDTIEKIIHQRDLKWAEENLGIYLQRNFHIDYSAVLSPEALPVMQFFDGQHSNLPMIPSSALTELLRQARSTPPESDKWPCSHFRPGSYPERTDAGRCHPITVGTNR